MHVDDAEEPIIVWHCPIEVCNGSNEIGFVSLTILFEIDDEDVEVVSERVEC